MDNKKDKNNKHTRDVKSREQNQETELQSQSDMSEKSIDEIIAAFIDGKDDTTEAIMSECSVEAQNIRDNINRVLETRDALVSYDTTDSSDSQSNNKNNNTMSIQKQLEDNIKAKIADLQGTLKAASVADQIQNKNSDVSHDIGTDNVNSDVNRCENQKENNDKSQISNHDENKINIDLEKSQHTEQLSHTHEDQSSPSKNVLIAKDDSKVNSNKKSSTKSAPKKSDQKEKASLEQLTKKLLTFETDSDRINYLSNRCVELMDENKSLSQSIKQNDRIGHQMRKEKDQMQVDHNRTVLAKSRLESLCRELQRQNKVIKEESLLKIKEEEEKRREIANKFQSTLNDIMQLIQENQRRNAMLKEENADLAQKLKTLMGHYENWEKHTEQIIKQKELETQLLKAKYAKTNLILNQEKEIFCKEKQHLITIITDLQKRCSDLTASELHLRTELSVYTTKYEEFQNVLSKSNDTFSGFKKDIEKMSKQIRKLEKETQQWKSKWESSNRALLVLAEEKQKRDTDLLDALQKIQTLEKLCRALQDERSQMQNQIKLYKDATQNGEIIG